MEAISLLKKWLQYAEYDPDQKSFSLFSTNYELHKCCETISALLPYDPTGIFSIMYAKYTFVELLKQLRVKAIDCVSNSILSATDAVTGVGTPMERREAERKFWIHKQKCSRVWNDQKRDWEFPDIPDGALQEYPETNFNFVIGFSKRGMKKLLQEYSRSTEEIGGSKNVE